ncbi:uncharacterized protein ACNLHF_010453 isoform 2-T2 [Anomaloglossus baeobatrachus]|uniref:uncharacterized protein LOC142292139 isoform X2 n=1 Tax=Anomaloglossus baeobatrachus TaxID=238106 RepID=UPI003F4FE33D
MPRQDVCAFCSSSEETASTRELQRTADGSLVAHYRCMLYSPMVIQKDSQEDTEGFDFKVESVRSEIIRGKKLKCTLCKNRGATIGCDVKSCKRTYHYLCLLKANGRTNSDEFVAYCAWHENVETTNDSKPLNKKGKGRQRLQKVTSKRRNNNIGHQQDNNDSWSLQSNRTRRRLKDTTGKTRRNDIKHEEENNGHPHTTAMQNVAIDDQPEATFLLAIHSTVEIDDNEEAIPSTSGQPMSSGTSSEESESILTPKVEDCFSLSGFPKQNRKYSTNRKPNKKLEEVMHTMSSREKRELSQIYTELGESQPNRTPEMDAASDKENGEMTTEGVTETSRGSDSSGRDTTSERLSDLNVHGIPSRCSTKRKHFTEEQPVSSQDEKIADKVSTSCSKRKKKLNNVISKHDGSLSSDGDISDGSAKDLRPQRLSETHPPGHSSITEPESILCSPLTLENDGSKAEVSTSVSDASLEKMENDLSTSPLSNGDILPVANSSNVKMLLNGKKGQNKRTISNIASPQQIMAISKKLKLGSFSGQFRSIVPQIQSTINSPRRNTTKNAEPEQKDGQATTKESTNCNITDQPFQVETNRDEPLKDQETSDDPMKKKDLVCLENTESITSEGQRFLHHTKLLPDMLPQQTELNLPEKEEIPENQDDSSVTEDSLLEESETPGPAKYEQPSEYHSGPSEMTTPVRRRLNGLLPRGIILSSSQYERVEDLDDMDGFGCAVAGQCRHLPEDRQAKYMSYILASADLFRAHPVLPEVDVLIANLRTFLESFEQSSP